MGNKKVTDEVLETTTDKTETISDNTGNITQVLAQSDGVVTIVGNGSGNLANGEERNVLRSIAEIYINNGEATIKE